MLVPLIRTLVSTKSFCAAFINAWRNMYLRFPSKEQCAVLYAQWQVETGGKAFWNWNIGNVKVTQAQVDAGVPYIDLPGTWEIVGGKKVVLQAGDPGRRFRAYASLDAGMGEQLALLRNTRYRSSWQWVEAGNPDAFARALGAAGYYTAKQDDYARVMVATAAPFMKSSAFDEALADAIAASEDPTQPEVGAPIVHPEVPLDDPSLDEPDDAA